MLIIDNRVDTAIICAPYSPSIPYLTGNRVMDAAAGQAQPMTFAITTLLAPDIQLETPSTLIRVNIIIGRIINRKAVT